MITKEFPHSFFNVVLHYDETKPETDYEKELVKRYLGFLTQLNQKRDLIKDLRNRCFHEQFMVDESDSRITELSERYTRLAKTTDDFKNSGTDDRNLFIKLRDEIINLNDEYQQFHKDLVEKINAVIDENEKDFNILFEWFENEQEVYKVYESFDDYRAELYRNYQNYSLDMVVFDRSINEMKVEWKKLDKEWDELYDIKNKTSDNTTLNSQKVNETNLKYELLNKILNEIADEKFQNINVQLEMMDTRCIQFRFLEKELFAVPADTHKVEVQFRIDFDLYEATDHSWIFNMDSLVFAHHEMLLQVRTSFKVPVQRQLLSSREILLPLYNVAFTNAFECADQFYKKEKKKSPWKEYKIPAETEKFLLDNLAERTAIYFDNADMQPGWNNHCFNIEGSLLERGTTLILNEVLFNNPAFSLEQNQKTFGQLVSVPKYVTLRCLIEKTAEGPQPFNVGQLFCFMLCIECASHLLTGDHLETLEPRLNEFKFDETIRKKYLADAQQFINDVLDDLKKKDSHFVDMEDEYRDWNSILK